MDVVRRSELIFLYDVKDANPNGDPDENKPRLDVETEINIVTDVRLKRTIRDYLAKFKGKDIWLKEEIEEDGSRKTREKKLEEAGIKNKANAVNLLEKYIDLRLFGATIAGKQPKERKGEEEEIEEVGKTKRKGEKVFTWIGPVQFRFGHSLHKVEPVFIKGTSVLPTQEMKAGGSFTESWIVPYSLICFYGLINENAAKDTKLTEEDINELLDGMWNGTKNLITRSKIGQVPRLLLRVIYNEKNYHIGDLDKEIKLLDINGKEIDKDGRNGKTLRSIDEVKVELSDLVTILKEKSDRIKEVQIEANDKVLFKVDDREYRGKKALIEGLKSIVELKDKIKELNLDK
jgi:CRISPR-associated protein Csh2